ncbi:MAG: flagellar basal body P-ring protein FlgI [Thermodesulfovibrionales bacterium]|nr:flagellar basal body P-ring protein FlgI [Thermodesulfovibrionales bacterium]
MIKNCNCNFLKAVILLISFLSTVYYQGSSLVYAERIKDIANFSGIRENELVGYGIVVGLNGTGDKDGTYIFQPFANMLTKMGVTVNAADIKGKTKNIAAVMVTARLQTMVKPGSRLDVQVSSIGDAKSLQGGTLIMTPLKGPDNNVYAVAQGPISIGGFLAGGTGAQSIKNHPNVGTIPNGAIVEMEVPVQLNKKDRIDLNLIVQDLSTARHTAEAINNYLKANYAKAEGPSNISINVPEEYKNKVVDLMAAIENIEVKVDNVAKVVVNERTGTIVIGEHVKISPIAMSHGGLTITIKTDQQVSQPSPLAPQGAQTVVTPQTDLKVEEKKAALTEIKGATIGQLVKALNALGVTPKDLVAILQAIKTSGSLKGELVIM